MSKLTAEEVAEKQITRLSAATEDVRRGVQRVTTAPGIKAAAKKDKMKARLNARIDDGTWGKNVAAVTLEEWKDKMSTKGVNRIPEGIRAAKSKQVEFYGKLLPAIDAAKGKISNMPDNTLEDGIARMTTFIREMGKFRK
jgi:hypothetical protein